MSLVLLLLPAVLTALLDLTTAPTIRLFGAHPSLCVALLSVWAVLRRREEAMVLAPVMGLTLGLLGNEPLGVSVIGLAPVVLLAARRNPEIAEGRFVTALGIAALGAAVYTLVLAVAVSVQGKVAPSPSALLRGLAGTVVLTAAVAALVYLPLMRVAWQPHVRGDFRRY